MAPEVIACDENPDATYDYRVRVSCLQKKPKTKPKTKQNTSKQKPKPYACSMNVHEQGQFLRLFIFL